MAMASLRFVAVLMAVALLLTGLIGAVELHAEALGGGGKGEDGFHKKDPEVDEDAVFEDKDEAKAAVCEACHAVHNTLAAGASTNFVDVCSQVDFGDTYFFATGKMEVACRRFIRNAENLLLLISRFLASTTKTAPGSMTELLLERGVDAARLMICKPLCAHVKHEKYNASYEDRWGALMQHASDTVAAAERGDEL